MRVEGMDEHLSQRLRMQRELKVRQAHLLTAEDWSAGRSRVKIVGVCSSYCSIDCCYTEAAGISHTQSSCAYCGESSPPATLTRERQQ